MSAFFDESEANSEIIKTLIKEITVLRSKLMGKLLRDEEGNIYMAMQFELVTSSEINDRINHLEKELSDLRKLEQDVAASPANAAHDQSIAEGHNVTAAPPEPPVPEQPTVPEPTQSPETDVSTNQSDVTPLQ